MRSFRSLKVLLDVICLRRRRGASACALRLCDCGSGLKPYCKARLKRGKCSDVGTAAVAGRLRYTPLCVEENKAGVFFSLCLSQNLNGLAAVRRRGGRQRGRTVWPGVHTCVREHESKYADADGHRLRSPIYGARSAARPLVVRTHTHTQHIFTSYVYTPTSTVQRT